MLQITHDRWILETVCGYRVELASNPMQYRTPNTLKMGDLERQLLDEELQRFERCDIIERVQNNSAPGEYISNIFIRPKKDGRIS